MPSAPFITRFAPSPTGYLHMGHALSAWIGQQAAGKYGQWLLRIEDIDAGRCRTEFLDAIEEDLAWLGLRPDGRTVQSQRLGQYGKALEQLRKRGLLYPCFCTRADIGRAGSAAHDGETQHYPGICRGQTVDDAELVARPHAWRLDLAATGLPMVQQWQEIGDTRPRSGSADLGGDLVLARKDVPTSYHLACVVDDAASGVTLVTRGEDLRGSTPLQRLLQQLLGYPEPLYLHHPLVMDVSGQRLAKRNRSETLMAMRAAGVSPETVHQKLEQLGNSILAVAGIDKSA